MARSCGRARGVCASATHVSAPTCIRQIVVAMPPGGKFRRGEQLSSPHLPRVQASSKPKPCSGVCHDLEQGLVREISEDRLQACILKKRRAKTCCTRPRCPWSPCFASRCHRAPARRANGQPRVLPAQASEHRAANIAAFMLQNVCCLSRATRSIPAHAQRMITSCSRWSGEPAAPDRWLALATDVRAATHKITAKEPSTSWGDMAGSRPGAVENAQTRAQTSQHTKQSQPIDARDRHRREGASLRTQSLKGNNRKRRRCSAPSEVCKARRPQGEGKACDLPSKIGLAGRSASSNKAGSSLASSPAGPTPGAGHSVGNGLASSNETYCGGKRNWSSRCSLSAVCYDAGARPAPRSNKKLACTLEARTPWSTARQYHRARSQGTQPRAQRTNANTWARARLQASARPSTAGLYIAGRWTNTACSCKQRNTSCDSQSRVAESPRAAVENGRASRNHAPLVPPRSRDEALFARAALVRAYIASLVFPTFSA